MPCSLVKLPDSVSPPTCGHCTSTCTPTGPMDRTAHELLARIRTTRSTRSTRPEPADNSMILKVSTFHVSRPPTLDTPWLDESICCETTTARPSGVTSAVPSRLTPPDPAVLYVATAREAMRSLPGPAGLST